MQPINDELDYYLAIDKMKSMIADGDFDSPEYHELRKEILRYQKSIIIDKEIKECGSLTFAERLELLNITEDLIYEDDYEDQIDGCFLKI